MTNYYNSFDAIQSDEQATQYEEREQMMEELKPYAKETCHGYGYNEYEVYNAPEEWTEDDLINFCDSMNFGGSAHRYKDGTARVKVYID